MADDDQGKTIIGVVELLIKTLGPIAPIVITAILLWGAYTYGNSLNEEARARAEESLSQRQNELNQAYSTFSTEISSLGARQLQSFAELYDAQEKLIERQQSVSTLEATLSNTIAEAETNREELETLRSDHQNALNELSTLRQELEANISVAESLTEELTDIREVITDLASAGNLSDVLSTDQIIALQSLLVPDVEEVTAILSNSLSNPNGDSLTNLYKLRGLDIENLPAIFEGVYSAQFIGEARRGAGDPTAWILFANSSGKRISNLIAIWSSGGKVLDVALMEGLYYLDIWDTYNLFSGSPSLIGFNSEGTSYVQTQFNSPALSEVTGRTVLSSIISQKVPGNWLIRGTDPAMDIRGASLAPTTYAELSPAELESLNRNSYSSVNGSDVFSNAQSFDFAVALAEPGYPPELIQLVEGAIKAAVARNEDYFLSAQGSISYYYDWGRFGAILLTNSLSNLVFTIQRNPTAIQETYTTDISIADEYGSTTKWEINLTRDSDQSNFRMELSEDYL